MCLRGCWIQVKKTYGGNYEKSNPVSERSPGDKAKEKLVQVRTETQGKTSSAAGNRGVAPKTGDAASYMKKGQFEDAVSNFNRAINLDPRNAVAHAARGSAYYNLNQLDKAMSDYNEAIELNPNNVDAYIYRGYYYQVMDEKSKAVADYSKALELNPEAEVAGRLRDEIAEMSANDDPKYAEAKDNQTIECHWTLPMNSNIKKQECKTREEWDKIEKTIQFERDVIQGPNYSYFINRIQGS